MTTASSPPVFHQVAYVVTDLDAAVRHWADVLGVGPWSSWTIRATELVEAGYRGAPADFAFRHALAMSGSLQVELVQPLHGPGIFADQLAAGGEGPNHLGMIVDDHSGAVAEHVARGFTLLQHGIGFGASRDGRFAYLSPPGARGEIIELIKPPTTRWPPEDVYPVGDPR